MTAVEQSRAPHDKVNSGFRRTLAGSMVGAVLEWYDFAIYGALAATVFAQQYFPGHDDRASLLLAFGTQAVGFIARPLGGVVFGTMGDRIGRKPALIATFFVLGLATGAIGLLPTYVAWGLAAPLCLVTLRFVQGFALGGEFGAAITLVSEHAKPRNRGWWVSIPQTGGPAGTLLGTAVLGALAAWTTQAQFDSWGWRVAFLIAIPLLGAGVWLRRGVEESPVFRESLRHREAVRAEDRPRTAVVTGDTPQGGPLSVVMNSTRALLQGLGVRTGENVAFYVYSVFTLAYATRFAGFSLATVLLAVTVGACFQLLGVLAGGAVSDVVGRRPPMIGAALALAVWAPLFFTLVNQSSVPLLFVAVCVGMLLHGLLAGPEAAWMAELFPTRHRTSGSSLAVQGSSIIGGGPAPLIATALVGASGQADLVVTYLIAAALLSAACAWWGPETRGIHLEDIRADTKVAW